MHPNTVYTEIAARPPVTENDYFLAGLIVIAFFSFMVWTLVQMWKAGRAADAKDQI